MCHLFFLRAGDRVTGFHIKTLLGAISAATHEAEEIYDALSVEHQRVYRSLVDGTLAVLYLHQ